MTKILVENQFGHGGHRGRFFKLKRWSRSKIGKAGIPFDWSTGFRVQDKIGVIPKKNQGASASCGGQAKAYFEGVVAALQQTQPYTEQSAKSIYSRVYLSYDGGTTAPALEKDLGVVDESIVPSYLNGQEPTEEYMIDTRWETTTNLKLALAKAGWIPLSVNIDVESIAQAIRDYGAIIWLIRGQNNGTWLSKNPQPPTDDSDLWGHFMCSEGAFLNNGVKTISMFQSWGDKVGDRGLQYFTKNYINSGYIVDAFTFRKKVVPPPPPPAPSIPTPKYQYTRNFGILNFGSDVKALQARFRVWQTGFFWLATLKALYAYQNQNHIPPTGYVDELTRQALNA